MEARSIQEIYDDMRACFIALMGMSGFDDLTLPAWQEGGMLRAIFMSLALEVGQGWMELETVWQTIFATTADKAGLRFHAADWDVDVDESDSEEQLRSQVLARIQMPDIGTPAWYAQECRAAVRRGLFRRPHHPRGRRKLGLSGDNYPRRHNHQSIAHHRHSGLF